MEKRSGCSENTQHRTYDIKPGRQKDNLENVILKLGAGDAFNRGSKAEGGENIEVQDPRMQPPGP